MKGFLLTDAAKISGDKMIVLTLSDGTTCKRMTDYGTKTSAETESEYVERIGQMFGIPLHYLHTIGNSVKVEAPFAQPEYKPVTFVYSDDAQVSAVLLPTTDDGEYVISVEDGNDTGLDKVTSSCRKLADLCDIYLVATNAGNANYQVREAVIYSATAARAIIARAAVSEVQRVMASKHKGESYKINDDGDIFLFDTRDGRWIDDDEIQIIAKRIISKIWSLPSDK